ncbi:uncharacterized protein ATNIH1004_008192 [Aspergillus tanneri]|uniref:Uncharacterized protein n=1 Tax=Aspergillus tanneri TaxID=1220188 RepID=A0A5M9ME29_9EURO|nr:uncharacterized protein ATNIH1004_008192 [Aspergillus tanneri]KAA8643996.1 hypothetical protein ATNIH1004_008192 [Aspergillus tanneri]
MRVPTSNFTFSTGSPAQCFTLSSSQDGSVEISSNSQQNTATSRTPRISPSPTNLFQNLNLSDTSAYANLRNASPSPRIRSVSVSRSSILQRNLRSVPTSNRASIINGGLFSDYRERVAESTSSGGRTERPRTQESVPEEEEDNEDDGITPSQICINFEHNTHNVRHEPLPSAPIYNSCLQDGLKDVKNRLGHLAHTMHLSELLETRTALYIRFIWKPKKQVNSNTPKHAPWGLSVTLELSRDGSACTCVVAEFRNSDDDHSPYTIEAFFMNTKEMKELLEELLQSEKLESLFKNELEMSLEYLSRDEEGAETAILEQLQRWALIGLAHRAGGPNSLQYSIISGDMDECKQQLDTLTADLSSTRPALWPFIKLVKLSDHIPQDGFFSNNLAGCILIRLSCVQAWYLPICQVYEI